jgi:glyoxylase-like metal-dependent hydrolase (beta-lactamase superfamily II)
MKYSVKEERPGVWFVDLKVGGEEEYTGAYIVASGKDVVLVEAGPSSTYENVLGALKEIGFRPQSVKYILLTHVHLDHGGAAGNLITHFSNAHVVAHQRGIQHLIDPETMLWKAANDVLGFVARIYGKPEPVPKERIISVVERLSLTLGKLNFEIIPTPGHASHHVCIFLHPANIVFTGDAAGIYIPSSDVVLPATPPPFKLAPALDSLNILAELEPKLAAYTHFNISSRAKEKLRKHCDQLIVWYECAKEIIATGIEREEEKFDLISRRDSDLRKFLRTSDNLGGLRRGMKTSLRGFLQIAKEEQNKVYL